jgi:tetratricopeptide (TPR) repeat protein
MQSSSEGECTVDSTVDNAVQALDDGDYARAVAELTELHLLCQRIYGEQDERTCLAISLLADLLRKLNLFDMAEMKYRQLLSVRQNSSGEKHEDFPSAKYSLSYTLFRQHKYRDAEGILRELLQARAIIPGSEDSQILEVKFLLGDALSWQWKVQEVHDLFLPMLQAYERILGKGHTQSLEIKSRLAKLYTNMHRYRDAERLYSEILQAGRSDEMTSKRLFIEYDAKYGLPYTLFVQEKFRDAEMLVIGEISDIEKANNSPLNKSQYLLPMKSLRSRLLYHQQKFDQAESLCREVLAAEKELESSSEEISQDRVSTECALAQMLFKQEKYQDARNLLEKVLNTVEKLLGSEHQTAVAIKFELLRTLQRLHCHAEVEGLTQEVRDTLQKSRESTNNGPAETAIKFWTGLILRERGLHMEAETLLQEALDDYEENLGHTHAAVHRCRFLLGRIFFDLKKYSQAEVSFQKILEANRNILGEIHLYTIKAKYWLACSLFQQQIYQPAKELLYNVLRDRKALLLEQHASDKFSGLTLPFRTLSLLLKGEDQALERWPPAQLVLRKEFRGALEMIEELRKISLPCFTYTPLEFEWQLRVVQVMPRQRENDKIKCKLHVIPGGDAQEVDPEYQPESNTPNIGYHALSYSWGNADDTKEIEVDGEPFYVTTNLYEFLKHTEKLVESEAQRQFRFWIDAISIDQSNNEEKSTQVKRMTSIYQHAEMVPIWLGPGSDETDMALQHIKNLAEKVMENTSPNELPMAAAGRLARDLSWRPFDENSELQFHSYDGIFDLLSRKWWSRVWIIQESTVPNGTYWFICGNSSILLPYFMLGIWTLHELNTLGRVPVPTSLRYANGEYYWTRPINLWIFHQFRAMGGEKMDLLNLLENARKFQATDDRDVVYSQLGMANRVKDTHFPSISYHKTTEEVYRNAAQFIIQTSAYPDTLNVLGHADDHPTPPAIKKGAFGSGLPLISNLSGSSFDFTGLGEFPDIEAENDLQDTINWYRDFVQAFASGSQGYIPQQALQILHSSLDYNIALRNFILSAIQTDREPPDGYVAFMAKLREKFMNTFVEYTTRSLSGDGSISTALDTVQDMLNELSLAPWMQDSMGELLANKSIPSESFVITGDSETTSSWIPDWRHESLRTIPFAKRFAQIRPQDEPKNQVYSASGESSEPFICSEMPSFYAFMNERLRIRGFRVDTIECLHAIDLEKPADGLFSELLECVVGRIGIVYGDQEELTRTALCRTMMADVLYNDGLATRRTTHEDISTDGIITTAGSYNLSSLCSGRQVAITAMNKLCLVSARARIDDGIYILAGGQVAYVLRERAEEDCYRLIGECYIHGLMDGEAMDLLKEKVCVVETLQIQ